MNNILLDGEQLVIKDQTLFLTIDSFSKLYLINISDDIKINITLKDNSRLDILDYTQYSINKDILINQENDTIFNYIHSFKIDGNYNLNILSKVNGDNNQNNIKIRGVSLGNANMVVDGNVLKDTLDNELSEDIKVYTSNGTANVSPILHVSSKEVIANHNTVISNFLEHELFYLMSKGIDRENAINLIENGLLYGNFSDQEFKDLIS